VASFVSVVVTTCLFTASHERTLNVTLSPCASITDSRDKHQMIKKNLIFITIFCLTILFSGVQNYTLFWNMPKKFREIVKYTPNVGNRNHQDKSR
jgi:hypothetical protein